MAAQLRFVSPKSLQAIKAERSRAAATLDASSSNWMTLPFLEALQILMDLVDFQYS